jgi:hypothetical protein
VQGRYRDLGQLHRSLPLGGRVRFAAFLKSGNGSTYFVEVETEVLIYLKRKPKNTDLVRAEIEVLI